MKKEKQKRQIQLVAREGVLSEIIKTWKFPTRGHEEVILLLYRETLEEMKKLGLEEV